MKKITAQLSPLTLAIAAIGATLSAPASAVKFDLENGITGSFESTVSFGMQRRMQSPDSSIISNDSSPSGNGIPTSAPLGALVNGNAATTNPDFNYGIADDGTLNYKKGDIVSAVVKGTHELFLKQQGSWSALGRFTWSSDLRSDHTRRTPLDPEARDAVKKDITLLDLWFAKEFSLGEQSAKIKFGNQVMNWGEDIFIIGGVNSINALDLRKIHIPGVQLKEVFVPAPMLSFSTGLGNGLSMETYYQFRWNKFIFDPAGTYWSSVDVLGKGGKRGGSIVTAYGGTGDYDTRFAARDSLDKIIAGGGHVPVEQTSPGNGGQYGLNLRFKPSDGETEYAGYYIRYHDKLPFLGFRQDLVTGACPVGGPCTLGQNVGGYTAIEQYGKDKELFGVSLNTKLGNWAVGAELSYRPRDSVPIDPTVPLVGSNSKPEYNLLNQAILAAGTGGSATVNGFVEEKKWQAHLTGFTLFPQWITQPLGAAEGYFMGELAVTHYPRLDLSGAVPHLLNNYAMPDKTSWGYVAEFGLTYANIFGSGWTMSPIIDFYHDVRGTSPYAMPFVEGRKAVAINLNFDYHNQWKANLGYTTFFGGGNLNPLRDRDVLSASVSYSF